jgi:hypothetical protein
VHCTFTCKKMDRALLTPGISSGSVGFGIRVWDTYIANTHHATHCWMEILSQASPETLRSLESINTNIGTKFPTCASADELRGYQFGHGSITIRVFLLFTTLQLKSPQKRFAQPTPPPLFYDSSHQLNLEGCFYTAACLKHRRVTVVFITYYISIKILSLQNL